MAGVSLMLQLKSTRPPLTVFSSSVKEKEISKQNFDFGDKIRNSRVLILGGTGRVGGSTAIALSKLSPELQIVVGGRNRERGAAMVKNIGEKSAFFEVDFDNVEALENALQAQQVISEPGSLVWGCAASLECYGCPSCIIQVGDCLEIDSGPCNSVRVGMCSVDGSWNHGSSGGVFRMGTEMLWVYLLFPASKINKTYTAVLKGANKQIRFIVQGKAMGMWSKDCWKVHPYPTLEKV